jgi:uridine phosphorylase
MVVDRPFASAVSRRPGPREHIRADLGQVGEYVLLPGDPGRVPAVAEHLGDASEVASFREFRTVTGRLDGTAVTVTSTGIGGPSAAIAIEELVQLGAHTFLRIGTCGAIQPYVHVGDLVIATAAVRDEGTTRQYAPLEYPAVSSPVVVSALQRAAATTGATVHIGVVHTTDTYYGQHEAQRMPVADELTGRSTALRRLGVLCSEMETATVLVVGGGVHAARVGSVLAVAGNRFTGESLDHPAVAHRRDQAVAQAIGTAIEAVRLLIQEQGAT